MNVWLVLPVKPFAEGKSRLSSVLDGQTRIELNRALMIHVLETALAIPQLAGLTVVSRDPNALAIARSYAVHGLDERGHGLNSALTQGRNDAMHRNISALLVLPADLPLLTIDDFQLLLKHGEQSTTMAIAPSPDGGTNALLLNPPDAISFQFGRNSFERHSVSARNACLTIHTVYSVGLQTDIDLPKDLAQLPPAIFSAFSPAAHNASFPQA